MAEALLGNGGLIPFVPRGEIVFEGINVRWEPGDFAEDDSEIEGEQEGDKVQAAVYDAEQEGGVYDCVCCAVFTEECLPSVLCIFRLRILGSRHHSRKDEEGN